MAKYILTKKIKGKLFSFADEQSRKGKEMHWKMQRRSLLLQISQLPEFHCRFNQAYFFSSGKTQNFHSFPDNNGDPMYSDVPKPRTDKSQRKPYPTPMKELIKRAKQEKEVRKFQPCRLLEHPPANGLLVPELVDVAHRVYRARELILSSLSKLLQFIPVQRCRYLQKPPHIFRLLLKTCKFSNR